MTGTPATTTIPLVDYLHLDGEPRLHAQQCESCAARYFDRRNACAHCGGLSFSSMAVPPEGTVSAFTIVTFAAPGVPVPFVAAVIDCGGTSVRANIVEVAPDPAIIHTGMPVRLTTFSLGFDADGVEAIGFGFAPLS